MVGIFQQLCEGNIQTSADLRLLTEAAEYSANGESMSALSCKLGGLQGHQHRSVSSLQCPLASYPKHGALWQIMQQNNRTPAMHA